jgi:hypothetical protein
MRSLNAIVLSCAAALVVGAAQAADLPTKKTPPAPPATNCYASFASWLDSTAADCPLTYMGITVYGQIDVGGGYETHASAFNKDYNNGVAELISKSSGGGKWQWVPNGLSQSNVGIKMKEQIAPTGRSRWWTTSGITPRPWATRCKPPTPIRAAPASGTTLAATSASATRLSAR